MTVRTIKSCFTFEAPFKLRSTEEILPPGSYDVETEEEIIEFNDRIVYRRIGTVLYLRTAGMTRAITIDADDLEIAQTAEVEIAGSKASESPHDISRRIDITEMSRDESYHLNREPHERLLADETTNARARAAHLKLAKMHGKMAQDAKVRARSHKSEK